MMHVFKIVSYRVMIHVYSGIWNKKYSHTEKMMFSQLVMS